MENAKNVFARRLLALRKDEKKTQKEIAADIGVDRATLSKYEKGAIAAFDIEVLQAIARRFKVSIDYLIGWTDSKQPAGDIRVLSDSLGLTDTAIAALQGLNAESKKHTFINADIIKKTVNLLLSVGMNAVYDNKHFNESPLALIGHIVFNDLQITDFKLMPNKHLLIFSDDYLSFDSDRVLIPYLFAELEKSLNALKNYLQE